MTDPLNRAEALRYLQMMGAVPRDPVDEEGNLLNEMPPPDPADDAPPLSLARYPLVENYDPEMAADEVQRRLALDMETEDPALLALNNIRRDALRTAARGGR